MLTVKTASSVCERCTGILWHEAIATFELAYARAMKVTKLVALSIVLAVASAEPADARPRPAGGGSMRSFSANKTFGLGLELGAPFGLTGKYFISDSNALQFGLGAIYEHYYAGDGLHLYFDYLWHPFSLVSAAEFELPFFIGVGGRFWDFDYCRGRNDCGYGGSAFGIRVPIGIAFDFNNVPLDIFVQLVPTLDFFRGDYYRYYDDRRTHFGIDGSVGIRYWFK
jgi:hypothetical protein